MLLCMNVGVGWFLGVKSFSLDVCIYIHGPFQHSKFPGRLVVRSCLVVGLYFYSYSIIV